LFQCDASIRVGTITGEVSDLLECHASDLQIYGWQPYVHKDSGQSIKQMAQELSMWRAGRYELRATARSGIELQFRIRTFVRLSAEDQRIHGCVDLVDWQSPRTYFDLKAQA
jgi:hypothetical protein